MAWPLGMASNMRTNAEATGGSGWAGVLASAGWLSGAPCAGSSAQWAGVDCGVGDGGITSLSLYENTLSGTLPTQIGLLTSLSGYLSLGFNTISGTLPTQLALLTNLRALYLGSNKLLSGTIPHHLLGGPKSSRRAIYLDGNRLSGTLPPTAARFGAGGTGDAPAQLVLSRNQLSGTLPNEGSAADWAGASLLFASHNRLSGTLPPQLSRATALNSLALSANRISGSLPPQYAALTSLRELLTYGNALSGTVPLALSELLSADSSTCVLTSAQCVMMRARAKRAAEAAADEAADEAEQRHQKRLFLPRRASDDAVDMCSGPTGTGTTTGTGLSAPEATLRCPVLNGPLADGAAQPCLAQLGCAPEHDHGGGSGHSPAPLLPSPPRSPHTKRTSTIDAGASSLAAPPPAPSLSLPPPLAPVTTCAWLRGRQDVRAFSPYATAHAHELAAFSHHTVLPQSVGACASLRVPDTCTRAYSVVALHDADGRSLIPRTEPLYAALQGRDVGFTYCQWTPMSDDADGATHERALSAIMDRRLSMAAAQTDGAAETVGTRGTRDTFGSRGVCAAGPLTPCVDGLATLHGLSTSRPWWVRQYVHHPSPRPPPQQPPSHPPPPQPPPPSPAQPPAATDRVHEQEVGGGGGPSAGMHGGGAARLSVWQQAAVGGVCFLLLCAMFALWRLHTRNVQLACEKQRLDLERSMAMHALVSGEGHSAAPVAASVSCSSTLPVADGPRNASGDARHGGALLQPLADPSPSLTCVSTEAILHAPAGSAQPHTSEALRGVGTASASPPSVEMSHVGHGRSPRSRERSWLRRALPSSASTTSDVTAEGTTHAAARVRVHHLLPGSGARGGAPRCAPARSNASSSSYGSNAELEAIYGALVAQQPAARGACAG